MDVATIIVDMGLDATIIKVSVPAEQIPLFQEYLRHTKMLRQAICNDKPLYKFTAEELDAYIQLCKNSKIEKFKSLSLDFANAEEVKHPSTKNPYGNLGYWRIRYGGSTGFDPEHNYLLGTLYEAFPDLHPNWGGYFAVEWDYARQIILGRIERLRRKAEKEKIASLEVFLETIDYCLSQPNPETYFLDWFP